MPCRLLVAAIGHRKALKGEIIACMPDNHQWGRREGLPDYVQGRISDATGGQVVGFLQRWRNTPDYTVLAPSNGRINLRIEMPARFTQVFGDTEGLKAEMKTRLEEDWGANVTVVTPNREFLIDVPDSTDLGEMKTVLLDQFEKIFGPRYIFTAASVDQAIANGGTFEITKAQAQARLVDRTI